MLSTLLLLLFDRLLAAGGAWKPTAVLAFRTGPEIRKSRRGSFLVPVWPRPNERWLSENRGRKGSPELLLERWSIRPKEKDEPVEGVEAAGDGCGAADGDNSEAGEGIDGGEAIDGGGGIGGRDMAGGGDRVGGGLLPAHVDVLFGGEKERSG